jgi:hypothetical protein
MFSGRRCQPPFPVRSGLTEVLSVKNLINCQKVRDSATYPLPVLPSKCSNLSRRSSRWRLSSGLVLPRRWPKSSLKASHSRMNCSRSLVRVMDCSGSCEPRARARKDATIVAKPPINVDEMASLQSVQRHGR